MKISMKDENVFSIAQIQELLKLENGISFEVEKKGNKNKQEMYDWISEVILKFRYYSIKKKDKGFVIRYIEKITQLSVGQIKKLIKRKRKLGRIEVFKNSCHKFPTIYGTSEIQRLLDTDNAHDRLSGYATKRIMERELQIFGNEKYEIISQISVAQIYNIRNHKEQYKSNTLTFKHTKAVQRDIGIRKKPQTDGKPGYLRVDSVHQGDLDNEKGVYHINLVCEVTQWEIIGCVEGISERYLLPLLITLLDAFPFRILGFHSDNGGEYINYQVSKMLQKLFIEQTKSRSRRSNDNGLVETKNGSIIRKHFGRGHIPKNFAKEINTFYKEYFYEYLNFHRPCGFATDTVSKNGKVTKKYSTYLTPFEKLKSFPNWESYLKENISAEELEIYSLRQSDNDCATKMKAAKLKLLEKLRKNAV